MTMTKRDNFSAGAAGLVIGSTTTQFATTRAIPVVINGRAVNVAIDTTQPFDAATSLAANQQCAFFILANASGVLSSQNLPVMMWPIG